MSDFIFSSERQPQDVLGQSLSIIYSKERITSSEFHGSWGSLAVTPSRYCGFQPLETDSYICVVIGGPVLYFQDNAFLGSDDDPHAGTRAILEHWEAGQADWSEDLSGPFVILVIDKKQNRAECITDLMMFIPVYQHHDGEGLFWGTHIDALAKACGQQNAFDEASLVDFILHDAVTYPYTAYTSLRQCQPASVHRLEKKPSGIYELLEAETYWQPTETNNFQSLADAAQYLRNGVQGYIDRVTGSLDHVAQFISAGEDSRALAGMLPKRSERDGYIFLDEMNREGRLAGKVAEIYGANFKPDYRNKTHYLDILPEASDLVGAGHQYTHAHTLGFDKKHHLSNYRAVFGGYIADSLLKAQYAYKPKWLRRFSFLPQVSVRGENRTLPVSSDFFSPSVLAKVTHRRAEHFERVRALRPESAQEWFELWPATMRIAIPNLYSNRRLFASHEVFMAKESVKTAASVPVNWKLNRRLFNKAFKPALKPSRFTPHADGRLPYYPWWLNSAIQAPVWFYQQVSRRSGLQKKNQGPWGDWKKMLSSARWSEDVARFTDEDLLPDLQTALEAGVLNEIGGLSIPSKVNFLQTCYQVKKKTSTLDTTPTPSVEEPSLLSD